MDKKLVCVAAIATAHGVHGAVKLKSFMESPETLCALKHLEDKEGRVFKVISMKPHKADVVIASFEGLKDRTAAEGLRGTQFYIPRADLPLIEDAQVYYHADLLHLNAHLTTGKKIGTVSAIWNHGAGDLLEVSLKDGQTICVPFRADVVPTVDLEKGFVLIDADLALTADDRKKV